MKVAYSPRAVAQINQAFNYIARDNPTAAKAFLARVRTIASLLPERSGIGRRTSKPDVQVIGLLPYRYLMFYKVLPRGDETAFIRVRNMSRPAPPAARGL